MGEDKPKLTEEERTALRAEQTQEIKLALGTYLIEYSQLTAMLRLGAVLILGAGGIQRQQLASAALANLDDRPLAEAFLSLGRRCHPEEPSADDVEVEEAMRNWLDRLRKQRNRIVHADWYVGWGNEWTTDHERAAKIVHAYASSWLELFVKDSPVRGPGRMFEVVKGDGGQVSLRPRGDWRLPD